MTKYAAFSDDEVLRAKLKAALPAKHLQLKSCLQFPSIDTHHQLVLIDGDTLPPCNFLNQLKKFNRNNIQVVYFFEKLDGKEVMDTLAMGVTSILFKDYPGSRIKKEIKTILDNFNYLEKVKELAESDGKTKQFLEVANTLTSNSDIRDTLVSIMNVVK
ncbi:MAG: hypothetical protein GY765_32890, partial [bacterium]|nr:hypothetical protein [bacterium]